MGQLHDDGNTSTQGTYALSVVIPVYNEYDNLDALHGELLAALEPLGIKYEIVYVNDGSRDRSAEKLEALAREHAGIVTFINLRRNFGQTAAIAAGIEHARGDVVILMDADMQNDPADIAMLLNEVNQGYDVVSGWRRRRKDKFITRRVPSMAANWLISQVTGVHLHDYGCTLKAYRREVMDEVRLYGEMHRFIPVFAAAAGASIKEVEVNHRARLFGKSNYGLMRTFKVVLDLITVKFLLSYQKTPMYLFGGVGVIMILTSMGTLGAAILNKILRDASLVRTPLTQLAATFFILGVQSILLGLTTELLVRTYHESQDKPIYVVQRVLRDQTDVTGVHARNQRRPN